MLVNHSNKNTDKRRFSFKGQGQLAHDNTVHKSVHIIHMNGDYVLHLLVPMLLAADDLWVSRNGYRD